MTSPLMSFEDERNFSKLPIMKMILQNRCHKKRQSNSMQPKNVGGGRGSIIEVCQVVD